MIKQAVSSTQQAYKSCKNDSAKPLTSPLAFLNAAIEESAIAREDGDDHRDRAGDCHSARQMRMGCLSEVNEDEVPCTLTRLVRMRCH